MFRNQVPVSVTIWNTPYGPYNTATENGVYAQDQWTMRKMTLNLGLRYTDTTRSSPSPTCRRARSSLRAIFLPWNTRRSGRISARGWAGPTTCSAMARRRSRRRWGGIRPATRASP